MSKEQINFRLESELKNELNELAENFDGTKDEFLEKMFNVYKNNRDVDIDLDLSKYDNSATNVKEAIKQAFSVVMSNVETMTLNIKQETQLVENKKKEISEKANEQLEKLEEEIKLLKDQILQKDTELKEHQKNIQDLKIDNDDLKSTNFLLKEHVRAINPDLFKESSEKTITSMNQFDNDAFEEGFNMGANDLDEEEDKSPIS